MTPIVNVRLRDELEDCVRLTFSIYKSLILGYSGLESVHGLEEDKKISKST